MQFRALAREEEPVNFRPLPGLEEEWAQYEDPQRSDLWFWLGIAPVAAFISITLVSMGFLLILKG